MTFTRETLRALRDAINAALAPVGKAHGVAITVGSISYREKLASAKLELAAVTEEGTVVRREAEDFDRLHKAYGFADYDRGRTFTMRGRTYELIGLNPRARKQPMIIRDTATNKEYKTTAGAVLVGLGRKTAKEVVNDFEGY
jgi:hypothetical protein